MSADYIVTIGADVSKLTDDILNALSKADGSKIKIKCDDKDIKRVLGELSKLDDKTSDKIKVEINGSGAIKTLSQLKKDAHKRIEEIKDELSNMDLDDNKINDKKSELDTKKNELNTKTREIYKKGIDDFPELPSDTNSENYEKQAQRLLNYVETYRHAGGEITDLSEKMQSTIAQLQNSGMSGKVISGTFSSDENQIKSIEDEINRYNSLQKELEEYQPFLEGSGSGSGTGSGSPIDNSQIEEAIASLNRLAEEISEIKNAFGTIDDGSGIQPLLSSISEMANALTSMKSVFVDVGEGQEFSPLLSMINNIVEAVSKLESAMSKIKLNINLDTGMDEASSMKIEGRKQDLLRAYQERFSAMKSYKPDNSKVVSSMLRGSGNDTTTGALNKSIHTFSEDIYDNIDQKIKAYESIIGKMEQASIHTYGENIYDNMDSSYKRNISTAKGNLSRAINSAGQSTQEELDNVFGKTDLSEVTSQLDRIAEKLDSIVQAAQEFKELFTLDTGLTENPIDVEISSQTSESLSKLKEALGGDWGTDLSALTNMLGNLNITEDAAKNMQALANAILTLKTNLNNLGEGGATFLSSIQELVGKTEGLKDLVTVLKSSKQDIEKAKTTAGMNKSAVDQDYFDSNVDSMKDSATQTLSDKYSDVKMVEITRSEKGLVTLTAAIKDADGAWKKFTGNIDSEGNLNTRGITELNKSRMNELERLDKTSYNSDDFLTVSSESIGSMTDEWNQVTASISDYKEELGNVQDITMQMQKNKKTGERMISYTVKGDNGNSLIVGANGDVLKANIGISNTATEARKSQEREIELLKEINRLKIESIGLDDNSEAKESGNNVRIKDLEDQIKFERQYRKEMGLETDEGAIINAKANLDREYAVAQEAFLASAVTKEGQASKKEKQKEDKQRQRQEAEYEKLWQRQDVEQRARESRSIESFELTEQADYYEALTSFSTKYAKALEDEAKAKTDSDKAIAKSLKRHYKKEMDSVREDMEANGINVDPDKEAKIQERITNAENEVKKRRVKRADEEAKAQQKAAEQEAETQQKAAERKTKMGEKDFNTASKKSYDREIKLLEQINELKIKNAEADLKGDSASKAKNDEEINRLEKLLETERRVREEIGLETSEGRSRVINARAALEEKYISRQEGLINSQIVKEDEKTEKENEKHRKLVQKKEESDHKYWQKEFKDSISEMTDSKNPQLEEMKKFYEEQEREAKEIEKANTEFDVQKQKDYYDGLIEASNEYVEAIKKESKAKTESDKEMAKNKMDLAKARLDSEMEEIKASGIKRDYDKELEIERKITKAKDEASEERIRIAQEEERASKKAKEEWDVAEQKDYYDSLIAYSKEYAKAIENEDKVKQKEFKDHIKELRSDMKANEIKIDPDKELDSRNIISDARKKLRENKQKELDNSADASYIETIKKATEIEKQYQELTAKRDAGLITSDETHQLESLIGQRDEYNKKLQQTGDLTQKESGLLEEYEHLKETNYVGDNWKTTLSGIDQNFMNSVLNSSFSSDAGKIKETLNLFTNSMGDFKFPGFNDVSQKFSDLNIEFARGSINLEQYENSVRKLLSELSKASNTTDPIGEMEQSDYYEALIKLSGEYVEAIKKEDKARQIAIEDETKSIRDDMKANNIKIDADKESELLSLQRKAAEEQKKVTNKSIGTSTSNMYNDFLSTLKSLNNEQERLNNYTLKDDETGDFSESIALATTRVNDLDTALQELKVGDYFDDEILSKMFPDEDIDKIKELKLFNEQDFNQIASKFNIDTDQIRAINREKDKQENIKETFDSSVRKQKEKDFSKSSEESYSREKSILKEINKLKIENIDADRATKNGNKYRLFSLEDELESIRKNRKESNLSTDEGDLEIQELKKALMREYRKEDMARSASKRTKDRKKETDDSYKREIEYLEKINQLEIQSLNASESKKQQIQADIDLYKQRAADERSSRSYRNYSFEWEDKLKERQRELEEELDAAKLGVDRSQNVKSSEESYNKEIALLEKIHQLKMANVKADEATVLGNNERIESLNKEVESVREERDRLGLSTDEGDSKVQELQDKFKNQLSTEEKAQNVTDQEKNRRKQIADSYKKEIEYLSKINQLEIQSLGANASKKEELQANIDAYTSMVDETRAFRDSDPNNKDQEWENVLTEKQKELQSLLDAAKTGNEKSGEIKASEESYNREIKLLKEIHNLRVQNITAKPSDQAFNNEVINHLQERLALERELRTLMGLDDAFEDGRSRVINTQALMNADYEARERGHSMSQEVKASEQAQKERDDYEKWWRSQYVGIRNQEVEEERRQNEEISTAAYDEQIRCLEEINRLRIENKNAPLSTVEANNAEIQRLQETINLLQETLQYEGLISEEQERRLSKASEKLDSEYNKSYSKDYKKTIDEATKVETRIQQLRAAEGNNVLTSSEAKELEQLIERRRQLNEVIENTTNLTEAEQRLNEQYHAFAERKTEMQLRNIEYSSVDMDANRNSNVVAKANESLQNLKNKGIFGLENEINSAEQAISDLTMEFTRGSISAEKYEQEVQKLLKPLHKVQTVLGENMTQEEGETAVDEYIENFVNSIGGRNLEVESSELDYSTGIMRTTASFIDAEGHASQLVTSLNLVNGQLTQVVETGEKTSLLSKMFDGLKEGFASIAKYASAYEIFDKLKEWFQEGVQYVIDFDTALTEMRKVSDESVSSLKNFQAGSFDMANEVGTTALQIQQSTADFMRLGETLDEAAESAKVANKLMAVSEFEGIEEATEALVAMKAAYSDIDQNVIVDKLNQVGNNFSISTDGLASALQRSASALTTAGNDIDASIALITAGNQVVQDPESVGAGIRTIALRLTGKIRCPNT